MSGNENAKIRMAQCWPSLSGNERTGLLNIAEWLSQYAPECVGDSYAALYVSDKGKESWITWETLPFMEYNVERTNKGLRATLATLKAAVKTMPPDEAYTLIIQGVISTLETIHRNFKCARATAYACADKRMPK